MAGKVIASEHKWFDAYPLVEVARVPVISRNELLTLLKSGARAGQDYLLIDLRRNDHEGGTIRSSLNLPAQSLYHSLPVIYDITKAAGISQVIWYCGSSRGRGSRAAGWFHDLLAQNGDNSIVSLALYEGIAGWIGAGAEYCEWIDGYDAKVWEQ